MNIQKRHSRRQIVEAIKHWQNVLKQMDESIYNDVIDALINRFGKNLVLSKTHNYALTQDDLDAIFKILNKYMFNNRIKPVPIILWPTVKIIDKLNYHLAMSGVLDEQYQNVKCYGVHSAICIDCVDANGNIVDIKVRDDYLMMNFDTLINCIFIFTVACVCHEMIHLYDRQVFKQYHDLALIQSQTKQNQDFHNTNIFKSKMKQANNNGINVVAKIPKGKYHSKVNDDARYVLKQTIGENDNQDVIVIKNDQMTYIKNKKTGMGVLTHFD